ncbi:hypothetical protein PMIT1303_01562 [Prochlorococcus sp. MIT 1303]|nr:hypothetical protein PMIT1303_01562 [Prochlorococcus sp. MIT 1303]
MQISLENFNVFYHPFTLFVKMMIEWQLTGGRRGVFGA